MDNNIKDKIEALREKMNNSAEDKIKDKAQKQNNSNANFISINGQFVPFDKAFSDQKPLKQRPVQISTEKKNEIKEEIKIIECTIYKTTDTLKDLKQRQQNRETVQALQERKAQGEAI